MGMGGEQQIMVRVTNRAMGMDVNNAHLMVRLSGMGGPTAPLALRPLPLMMGGMADGLFGATARLMPGTYTATVTVDGTTATLPHRSP